jgi:hypothetical protein
MSTFTRQINVRLSLKQRFFFFTLFFSPFNFWKTKLSAKSLNATDRSNMFCTGLFQNRNFLQLVVTVIN